MSRGKLSQLSDEELVAQFRLAAVETGEAIVNWRPAAHKKRRLLDIEEALCERGQNTLLKLSELLKDRDRFARYYAATELLNIIPQQCLSIIEENTREFDALAGHARFCLRLFNERKEISGSS